jgi:hypothetical protein
MGIKKWHINRVVTKTKFVGTYKGSWKLKTVHPIVLMRMKKDE